jgi:MFS family permease
MLILLASIGFARFAYGAILPLMTKDLGLDSFHAGLVATGQNTCYLVFAWVGGRIVRRMGYKKLIAISLAMCGVSTFSSGLAENFASLLIAQSFAGVFSGLATIPSYGLVFSYFNINELGKGIGITNGGAGLGLALTGVIEPLFSGYSIDYGWRLSWFFYGICIITISLIVPILLLRERKESLGSAVTSKQEENQSSSSSSDFRLRDRRVAQICLVYFIFGLVYIIYVTYFPSFVSIQLGYGIGLTGDAWKIVGLLAITSGLALGSISDRIGRLKAVSLEYLLLSISFFMPVAFGSIEGVYISALLFGVFLFGIPTVVISMVGNLVSGKRVAEAVGFITIFFGIGQSLGPAIAGYISNLASSYDLAFLFGSSLALIGLVSSIGGRIRNISEIVKNEPGPSAQLN